ncbi:MAG: hypothetical protein H7066_02000 [Cytophagaceae bacterium]|nr:hypothetical protein [Gemmatimonadaceae bacterium]
MIRTLAFRNLVLRPWRTILLLAGFGLGVGVMITLLSIGDAMVVQGSEERLVGGGNVTVLPEGVDLELLKTGGVGGMWFSVPNARFIHRQLLTGPRHRALVTAAAPQLEGKLVYLTTREGRQIAVRAGGEIPSASAAVGNAPTLAAGTWEDDAIDRRWIRPGRQELRHDIDHFHETPAAVTNRDSWGEWHYFNIVSADGRRWAFLTFMLGGDVPRGAWGGQLLLTLHEQGQPARRFSRRVARDRITYTTDAADLVLDDASVTVDSAGAYRVQATIPAEGGGTPARVDLVVAPEPGGYFPGASLGSGTFVSGYVVAGLRANGAGTVCAGAWCERFDRAQAYHDHNWGTWRGVTWDWGSARAGDVSLLYGRVIAPDSLTAKTSMFVYLVDSLGFLAVFRPRDITYVEGASRVVGGQRVRIPARALMEDARGADTLRIELDVEDATATDMRRGIVERGDAAGAGTIPTPWFLQLKGRATVRARVGGRTVGGTGTAFFETWR